MDSVADDESTDEEIKDKIEDKPPTPPPTRRQRGRRKDPLGPDSDIGLRLRALYSEFENEPIPTQLIDLLEKLSEAEAKAAK